MKKKLFISIFFIVCISIGISLSVLLKTPYIRRTTQPVAAVSIAGKATYLLPSPTPTPGIPKTIIIPAINLVSSIEPVGLDAQQRMDVPKKPTNVGWYHLGVRPGENGNAVIDGHVDLVTGKPAVFWEVKQLVPGNTISITDENNKQYTFIVTKKISYDFDKVPMQGVFSSADTPHLNVITCSGKWDASKKNYSKRIVVYADLKK